MTRLLRENHGVTTLRQLRVLGFTPGEVKGLVAHGALRSVHRGVYADGRAQLGDRAILRAALLAAGEGAWLSGQAAAMGWSLTALSLARLEVTVVSAATPRRRPGLRVRSVRTAPYPSEIRTRNGLRLSSVPRLLIEAAGAGATREQLDAYIEAAVRAKRLDTLDLEATLARHGGRRGVQQIRATCSEYLPAPGRQSWLEHAFDRWLLDHPEIPQPQRNIRFGPWEIDCYWPAHRLALELDGRAYHTLTHEFERDRRKDAWLQTHGIVVLRVTAKRFRDERACVHRDLTTMLAAAA